MVMKRILVEMLTVKVILIRSQTEMSTTSLETGGNVIIVIMVGNCLNCISGLVFWAG